jgi:hypothetical protein
MANQRLYGYWSHLTEALRTGLPQNETRGGGIPLFEALYADPARLKSFLAAMTGVSHGANVTIATKFPWANYKTFTDAGTAQGDLAVQIALANPHLAGTGFDLAEVGPIFEEYVEKNGVSGRLRFAAGSFFEQPLPPADVILMGHILDGPHSARLGIGRKTYADFQSLRSRARRRCADRLRKHH